MSKTHSAKDFNKSNKWLVIGVGLAIYDTPLLALLKIGVI